MATILGVTTTFDVRLLPAMRRNAGLTQAELAARIGCRQEDIARLERATQRGELVDKIIAALAALADTPAPETAQN